MSANHLRDLDRALAIVHAAAEAGADAVKLQTYTADTLTLNSDAPPCRIASGTLWDGTTLHELYGRAALPWEWHQDLFEAAAEAGIACFSSPFDPTAVELLESLDTIAYKIASFEIVDLPLIRTVAATGKPLIISTGLSEIDEIDAAVRAARDGGAGGLALLRTNSSYPADPAELDLRTIPDMQRRWSVPIGFSDHTRGIAAPVAAVAIGASLVEKHLTLRRADGGPDADFSLEPEEFAEMVAAIRVAEQSLGDVRYGPSRREQASLGFRRSLFVVRDVQRGAVLGPEDVRSIRPAGGLAPRHLGAVLGRRARGDLRAGTPLSWDHVEGEPATDG